MRQRESLNPDVLCDPVWPGHWSQQDSEPNDRTCTLTCPRSHKDRGFGALGWGGSVSKCQGVFMDERWGEGVGQMTGHSCCWCTHRHLFMSPPVWVQQNYLGACLICFRKGFLWRYLLPPGHRRREKQITESVFSGSGMCRMQPYTYCLRDVIKKKPEKLSEMSSAITTKIRRQQNENVSKSNHLWVVYQ